MSQTRMIFMMEILTWVLVAYISTFAYMYFFQRNLVFRPSGNPFQETYTPYVPWVYETSYGLKLRGLWYPPEAGKKTIVIFQGNAGNIGGRRSKADLFREQGMGTALVGYRGYNGNPGQPTEEALYTDARQAIKSLIDKGVKVQDMILYGESLGTGVAIQMALEHPQVKAVILEAPYTSIVDVASKRFWFMPVRKILKDRFDNMARIAKLKMPLLIVHGTEDRTVTYDLGRRLYDQAQSPDKGMLTIDKAGHSDLYAFRKTRDGILDFLNHVR